MLDPAKTALNYPNGEFASLRLMIVQVRPSWQSRLPSFLPVISFIGKSQCVRFSSDILHLLFIGVSRQDGKQMPKPINGHMDFTALVAFVSTS